MKAEINNENKAKFFAQYWGQEVIRGNDKQIWPVCSSINLSHENWWLELKPLSDISEEYAIEVAIMLGCNDKNSREFMISYGKDHVRRVENRKSDIVDFLRSRGYLVPWLGLSCEEIIEAGWVKLRKDVGF